MPLGLSWLMLKTSRYRTCLPAATTRKTVGQTIVEQLLTDLAQLQASQSIFMA